jgi:alpha-1,2-mannosyltransferase
MRTEGLRVLLVRAAYAVALIAAIAWASLLITAGASTGTLGYDFRAYDLAVDRMLAGQSMYDLSATSMGAFGLFFYPPPFALLILPFAVLPTELAVGLWTLGLIVASVAAVALLPVSPRTRLVVLLLAAFSWPLVYAIKLGQVGSLLLLLFAAGWRWMDRPWPLGLATALGTVIKLQPALLVGWALVRGKRQAAFIAVGAFAIVALVATLITGPQAWSDWLAVLGNVSRPVLADNDMGFGHLAYRAGVPLAVATTLHYLNVAAIVLVTTFAVVRATPVASFLAVVVASQFVSPVLWDHYALILLLPVAWLIDRGRLWAALIPLASSTFLVGITPRLAYPVLFWITLLAVVWVGLRRTGQTLGPRSTAA